VISLRNAGLRPSSSGPSTSCSVLAAAALTCASFAGVLRSMRQPSLWAVSATLRARDPAPERVVFVTLRDAPPSSAQQTALAIRSARLNRPVAPRVERSSGNPPRDTGSTQPMSTAAPATATEPGEPYASLSPSPMSPRLVPPRLRGAPWYSFSRRRHPLAPSEPLSAAERDSTLRALGAEVPQLAARRLRTQSERDAAAKEAMLKIHLSGRPLLVPPDNTGGMITASIPLPLFGAGPSKARRQRESEVLDENQARIKRLTQRTDSLRRARVDSLLP
jgi:hypothetical protein